jgi:hypothetical protein
MPFEQAIVGQAILSPASQCIHPSLSHGAGGQTLVCAPGAEHP